MSRHSDGVSMSKGFVYIPEHEGSGDYVDTVYRVYLEDEREALEAQGKEVFWSSWESMESRCLYGRLRLVFGSERARQALEPMVEAGRRFRARLARDREILERVVSRRLRRRLGLEV